MASLNQVTLLGNLTRDPELRYLADGTAVTDIGLAISESYKNKNGEKVEDVVFIDVTLWQRTAEVACEYLTKGSPVLVVGRLKLDSWQDKTSGEKRTKIKVTGDKIQFLGGKTKDEYHQPSPPNEGVDAPHDESTPF
jgi:single-strand DNA-binding protein